MQTSRKWQKRKFWDKQDRTQSHPLVVLGKILMSWNDILNNTSMKPEWISQH